MSDSRTSDLEQRIYAWRGLDGGSLEVLRLTRLDGGYVGCSIVLNTEPAPFAVEYELRLDGGWRSQSLDVRVIEFTERRLRVERSGDAAWRIDEQPAPYLDGCEELDLSITPFCNTLALRRLGPPPGAPGELTALYIEFPELVPRPSRQRYERAGMQRFRYVDLGAHAGFEAVLAVDEIGIVTSYEGLFERVGA